MVLRGGERGERIGRLVKVIDEQQQQLTKFQLVLLDEGVDIGMKKKNASDVKHMPQKKKKYVGRRVWHILSSSPGIRRTFSYSKQSRSCLLPSNGRSKKLRHLKHVARF